MAIECLRKMVSWMKSSPITNKQVGRTFQNTVRNQSAIDDSRSLSRRFSATFSLVVITILFVFSLVVVLHNYFELKAELDRQLTDTVELAETSLPTAVWQMDFNSMNDILEAILINDSIASVRILMDDTVAVSKIQPQYSAHDFFFFRDSPEFMVKSQIVYRGGEEVGVFEVAISRAKIRQGVSITVVLVIIQAATLCVAIILTSMLITRRYIFTPLMKLESHARLVARGNLESNIEMNGSDEFARLAGAFNIMATELKLSFETLEQKVMERTADLYHAKTEAERVSQHLSIIGEELQALLDNSPAGILFVNFERIIQRVNPEVEKITGYSKHELIGDSTRKLYASEALFAKIGEKNYAVLRAYGYCETNVEIRTKSGEHKICYWRGKVVGSDKGVEGVIWILEDISKRLQMEDELLRVKKLESIGILAGGIAHDFNNLLLAIIGNISLAKRLSGGEEELYALLDSAHKASERAKDLTAKLLTFSSGGEPVKATESLPQLLEESASFVLSGSNVKCSFDFQEDLWPVEMDRSQINQVIQNLIVNADQAMLEGGTVQISCRNTKLEPGQITDLEGGRYVCVAVKDQGCGIAEDIIDKIFDPYFSTKQRDSNKGSGLGLSIVHSIVTKHGGIIQVDSKPERGSTFTIYLPAIQHEGNTSQPDIAEEVTRGKGRILVMDDEEIIRAVVCNMLEYLGYETVQASDGREALTIYRQAMDEGARFDAVIMDLTIPGGMGGVEATRLLIDMDTGAKVIVSSGYSGDPVLDDFKSFGFCHIVSKPYQLSDLSRVLAETLAAENSLQLS